MTTEQPKRGYMTGLLLGDWILVVSVALLATTVVVGTMVGNPTTYAWIVVGDVVVLLSLLVLRWALRHRADAMEAAYAIWLVIFAFLFLVHAPRIYPIALFVVGLVAVLWLYSRRPAN